MGLLYFLVCSIAFGMVILIIIAMVANYKTALVCATIGAVLRFFAYWAHLRIVGYSMKAEWITHFVLLIVAAIVIVIRHLRKTRNSKK